MSAIAAILDFDGAPPAINALLTSMVHRGPDGESIWRDAGIALGHRLLINTPEAREERQPVANVDQSLRIVWDGRLDNRKEIAHELALRGVSPRDVTDPELVLQLFQLFREQTPKRLLGDFAFAIYDKHTRSLFVARDQVGARPLHYLLTDKFFAVTSDEEALESLLSPSPKPNISRVVYAAIPALTDFDWSVGWIDGIHSVAPGTWLRVDAFRRVHREQYWRFKPKASVSMTPEDALDGFTEVLNLASRDRLRAADPVAVLLSGGIDSACVAAAVQNARIDSAHVQAYSVVSDSGIDCLESPAIASMIDLLKWKHRRIEVPSLKGRIDEAAVGSIAWTRPHPVDNSLLLVAMLANLAAADGRRVMLHGASGDLAFWSPDHYLFEFARAMGMAAAWREMNLARSRHVYLHGTSRTALLTREVWNHAVPAWTKSLRTSRLVAAQQVAANSGLHADVIAGQSVVDRLLAVWSANDVRARRSLENQHVEFLGSPGLARGLQGYDRVASKFGLEARDPLADVRVIEWMLQSPIQWRVSDGRTKWIAREFVRRRFGDAVADRNDKSHLGWVLSAAALKHVPAGAPSAAEQRLLRPAKDVIADADPYTQTTLHHWLRMFR